MKQLLFLLVTLLPAAIAFSQTTSFNCAFFRTGSFSYRDTSANSISDFKRTARLQVEKTGIRALLSNTGSTGLVIVRINLPNYGRIAKRDGKETVHGRYSISFLLLKTLHLQM